MSTKIKTVGDLLELLKTSPKDAKLVVVVGNVGVTTAEATVSGGWDNGADGFFLCLEPRHNDSFVLRLEPR